MFRLNSILVASAVLLILPIVINTQKTIEIEGYIVDENDKPVSGAEISWVYEPEEFASDGLNLIWPSFDDGSFGIVTEWKSKRKLRMFFQAPRGTCFTPLEITDSRLRKLPKLQGIIIAKYRRFVNLGKVKNYIKFAKIRVDLANAVHTLVEEVKNGLIYLKIKDLSGNVVSESTINPAYLEASRSLEFCLQEGQWHLELYGPGAKSVQIQPQKVVVDSRVAVINIDIVEEI